MAKEECILFPAIEQMEREQEGGPAASAAGCGLEGPIAQMRFEHRSAVQLLEQLRPCAAGLEAVAGSSWRRRFAELADDLGEHIRLEEEELFPLAHRLAGI
jgi:iron-sulfur cluster repair protein YtfE (RIC family)